MVSTKDVDQAQELEVMLTRLQEMIIDYVKKGQSETLPVVNYKSPEELYKTIDFKLPNEGAGIEGTFELIESAMKYSVNSWNPRFMDKLYAGTNPIGVISELLLAVMNSNSHVYHVSPVFTLMEIEVTKAVGQLLNMGQNAGGLLCPGGAASNLLAMVTARNKFFPMIKTEGYFPRPINPNANYGHLKVFTSAHGHYSIDKTAQLMGLGTNNVIKVPVDDRGRMKVDELERLILASMEKGETPFFINATAGTTVLGAFDPIREISTIAKKYSCWLHVDGSWGGGAVFSKKVREERDWFDGSELADTFTLNPHKLLGVPLQCSMLITPHDGHLLFARANTLAADYLFHGNPYDLGAGTVGCGRRPDAVKIFLSWKFYGQEGLGRRIDRALASAEAFTDLVRSRAHKGFKLVKDPCSFLQICFWFVPPQIKQQQAIQNLSRITRELHRHINQSGEFLVDHAPVMGEQDFFRVVINAPSVSVHGDLERLLDAIEEANLTIDWNNIL
ncbi:pyridoxal phosphate-dependent transferase [Cokeromyces recurvatus]|uniref:pyridoxal phosphate-dependent transferase n=1 Tax=Cokeromyces recurvatus TaxID=90255 RepID=UPI0022202CF4|nr:pyridoxal phosphate-dependent transferase [Cokeromyces recurvatus]KAI7905571.1 pyridoxal phosphate-dependent transferase [Cokeromyces recurvatus]